MTPLAPTKGVAFAPPNVISDAIKAQVAKVLAEIPADGKAALVVVPTAAGLNAAFAVRGGGGWEVGAWVGKSGWDSPLDWGAHVKKVWR